MELRHDKHNGKLAERGVDPTTTLVGLSERAARSLIKEKDPEIKEQAISEVASKLKREKQARAMIG
jgi:hypothetical protein